MTTPTPEASGEPLDLRPLKIAIGYMPCETAYQRNEQIKAWKAYDAVKTALDVASLPPAQQGEDVAALLTGIVEYANDAIVLGNTKSHWAGVLALVGRLRAALDARQSPPQEVQADPIDPTIGPELGLGHSGRFIPARVPPPQGTPEESGEALEQLAQETCAQIRGHKHAVALIHQCWTCTSVLAALQRARETGKP